MKHADQSNAALKPGKLTQPLSVRIQTTLKKMGRQWQIQFMALSGVVWMAIFSYIPLIFLVIAFMDYKVSIPLFENQSVGLKHFKAFLTDDRFWLLRCQYAWYQRLKVTIGFVVPIIFAATAKRGQKPEIQKSCTVALLYAAFYFMGNFWRHYAELDVLHRVDQSDHALSWSAKPFDPVQCRPGQLLDDLLYHRYL